MSLASRIMRPLAMGSNELERLIRSHFGGGSTSSGVSVSSDSAMRQATVYSCINILSRVIGTLPCHMMERIGKNRNIAENFYLYPLLHDMPNEWMTAPEFWGMTINHLALRGNFFAFKNTGLDPKGKTRELIPLAPGRVQEVIQTWDYGVFYKVLLPNEETYGSYGEPTQALIGTVKTFPASQMFHLRGMVSNGLIGINPIQYIRESIGLGLSAEEFGARFFGSGSHPGMIIEYPGRVKDLGAMRAALSETYAGLGKTHQMMLLEEGLKATKATIDPKDSQFIDLRKYQKAEIVDIFFGMPLTVMSAGLENTPTYASAEQFSIGFVIYALMPWVVTIEKGIYRDLLNPEERKTFYAKFQAQGLQRGSFKEQMDGFAVAIDKEIFNPNECRELLDMNPYPGGEVYKTRTSTTNNTGANTRQGANP